MKKSALYDSRQLRPTRPDCANPLSKLKIPSLLSRSHQDSADSHKRTPAIRYTLLFRHTPFRLSYSPLSDHALPRHSPCHPKTFTRTKCCMPDPALAHTRSPRHDNNLKKSHAPNNYNSNNTILTTAIYQFESSSSLVRREDLTHRLEQLAAILANLHIGALDLAREQRVKLRAHADQQPLLGDRNGESDPAVNRENALTRRWRRRRRIMLLVLSRDGWRRW